MSSTSPSRPLRIAAPGGGPQAIAPVLALLAHELRNPLVPMRLRIRLARATRLADEELGHCFDVMERQLDYLQRLVDDLAVWARPAGTVDLVSRRDIDLADIAQAGLEAFAPLAQARRLTLSLDVQPGAHHVRGDEDRLTQLLVNLLGNAFKFTAPGGHVALGVRRRENDELLQVGDSGVGIAPAQLPRVFEPFYTGAPSSGLGLGLAVVRQVAAAHGGWVRAHSAGVGLGATFTVGLPALRDPG